MMQTRCCFRTTTTTHPCCLAVLLRWLHVRVTQATIGVSAEASLSWQDPHAEPLLLLLNLQKPLVPCFAVALVAGQDHAGDSGCVSVMQNRCCS
jgi:hypothetical protein